MPLLRLRSSTRDSLNYSEPGEMPKPRRKTTPDRVLNAESSLSSAPDIEDVSYPDNLKPTRNATGGRTRRKALPTRPSAGAQKQTHTPATAFKNDRPKRVRKTRKAKLKELDSEGSANGDGRDLKEEANADVVLNRIDAHPVGTPAEIEGGIKVSTPKKGGAKIKPKTKVEVIKSSKDENLKAAETPVTKTPRKRKVKQEDKDQAEANGDEEKPKIKKQRKTKEEKEAEAMPIAARTVGSRLYIGAHVSSAKGVQNAVTNAVYIGGNAFALFLKSQRKWTSPPLASENIELFQANCKSHRFDAGNHVVPHGSYLVNLAQLDRDKATQAYDCFLEDLQRCEALGIKLYNFHPGSTGGHARSEALGRIASQLNRAHKATKSVVTLLENMANGRGNVIGARFEDLRDIIALVDDKERVGVCLDTCHAFAAGHDLRTPEAFKTTIAHFDSTIGLRFLKAFHINDSKAPFNSHRDLHQNIGLGFLGLRAFWNVVNWEGVKGLPLVLETPIDRKDENGKDKEDKGIWAREIKLLERMVGMDPEGEEFLELERALAAEGAEERKKLHEQFERRVEKDKKEAGKKAGKGKGKKVKDETDSSELSSLEAESDA